MDYMVNLWIVVGFIVDYIVDYIADCIWVTLDIWILMINDI